LQLKKKIEKHEQEAHKYRCFVCGKNEASKDNEEVIELEAYECVYRDFEGNTVEVMRKLS
jgi:hypothetical protein